jgi:dihydrofolate reductase
MNDFAHAFTAVKKIVVFSRSLSSVSEKNTSIVHGDLKEEILKLKQQDGKNMLTGGVDIPSQLTQLGLVDEYHFVIQPLVVGEGRRLLESVSMQKKLQLEESKIFKSGCVALHYVKS